MKFARRRPQTTSSPVRDALLLLVFWLVSVAVDRLWLGLDQSVPAWDQSDHVRRAIAYWQAMQMPQWGDGNWWTSLWQLSPSYRAPLVYLATVPFLGWRGLGVDQALWVNSAFSVIWLLSLYGLGRVLFRPAVGLWAAGLGLALPFLVVLRVDYLLDYGLTAMVALTLLVLTLWRQQAGVGAWGWAILSGLLVGLTLLTKPTGLFFVVVPVLWVLLVGGRSRIWGRVGQTLVLSLVALAVIWPWLAANWLTILGSSSRSIATAETEGSIWLYYLGEFPTLVPWPLLLAGLGGLLVGAAQDPRTYFLGGDRPRAWRWLLVGLLGGYVVCTLIDNRIDRHLVPLTPWLLLPLAAGLCAWQGRLGKWWRWLVGASLVALSVVTLFPVPGLPLGLPGAGLRRGEAWPHQEVIAAIRAAEPQLLSTVGVIPNSATVNPFTIDLYGALAGDFQVFGRELGFQPEQVVTDGQALPWYITQRGDEGASLGETQIIAPARAALNEFVETEADLVLSRTWGLPDGNQLRLWRAATPLVSVTPLESEPDEANSSLTPLTLTQVTVPAVLSPGSSVPVTLQVTGAWQTLTEGMLLLTWEAEGEVEGEAAEVSSSPWFQDLRLGAGRLAPTAAEPEAIFQVTERLALAVPPGLAGRYQLRADYLQRQTGEIVPLEVPDTIVTVGPSLPDITVPETAVPETEIPAVTIPALATPATAPPFDLVTQITQSGPALAAGDLAEIFEAVTRWNQYDPRQDYLPAAVASLRYRWSQDPDNVALGYSLGLAQVLQRQAGPASETFAQLTVLAPDQAAAWAYLAVTELYQWRPWRAQPALAQVAQLDPDWPELETLQAIANGMQLNLVGLFMAR